MPEVCGGNLLLEDKEEMGFILSARCVMLLRSENLLNGEV